MKPKPLVAVTMGDPAGVGPELAVRATVTPAVRRLCRPVLVGDFGTLRAAAERVALGLTEWDGRGEPPRGIPLVPVSNLPASRRRAGRPTAAGARAGYLAVERAADLAVRGVVGAMCTAPLPKRAMPLIGGRAVGHTETLARLTGARRTRMMFFSPRLRVVLVTAHVALRQVPAAVTPKEVLDTIVMAGCHLQRYGGRSRPRLAVAGLNPHAGEGGAFGREEENRIAPAISRARRLGWRVEGPVAPDTVFLRALDGGYDAVVALYHDQGLIPVKLLHFHDAVNVTLGLPIIRTSPDHGTGYDIAGRGEASPRSLVAAVCLAARMARRGG